MCCGLLVRQSSNLLTNASFVAANLDGLTAATSQVYPPELASLDASSLTELIVFAATRYTILDVCPVPSPPPSRTPC